MIHLQQTTLLRAPVGRCFDLARSVEVHLAGNTHWGESAVACQGVTAGLLTLGDQVTWRARHFGAWQNLTSEITSMHAPYFFQDKMIHGPFRSMEHDHYFRALPSGETEMKDVFRVAAPIPILGRVAELAVLAKYMNELLRERNAAIKSIAESTDWPAYLAIERSAK